MSAIANIYITVEKLETLLKTAKAKGVKGIGLDIGINDETNDYGQNVSVWVNQSKEDRDNKKAKYYVANGGVKWTDGTITKAEPKQENKQPSNEGEGSDGLPF
jgi:hypothetical protein